MKLKKLRLKYRLLLRNTGNSSDFAKTRIVFLQKYARSRGTIGVMDKKSHNPSRSSHLLVQLRLVKALHDVGVCIDENGRLRCIKTQEVITKENLRGDPLITMAAITHYVILSF